MKLFRFDSIRLNLILVVLFGALPMLAMILWSGVELREKEVREAKADALRMVRSFGEQQESVTRGVELLLSTLSLMHEQHLDHASCTTLFKALVQQHPVHANFILLDPNGNVLAAALPFAADNFADRKHVAETMRTRDFSAGEYIVSRFEAGPVIAFAYPVIGQGGELTGILTTSLKLDHFVNMFDMAMLPEGSSLGIFDGKGTRLLFYPYKPETNPVGERISPHAMSAFYGPEDEGVASFTPLDGVRRYFAFQKLRLKPQDAPYLVIAVGIPEAVILARADKLTRQHLYAFGLAASLSLLAAWLTGKYGIINPLKRFAGLARRVGEGDLDAVSGMSGGSGTLNIVATAFDGMVKALKSREAERRVAEQVLRASGERFRHVVEGTDNLITQVDGSGRFLYVNPVARKVFGLEPEECVGRLAFEFVHENDRETTERAFKGWIAAGLKHMVFENRLVSLSGEVRRMSWTIDIHYDDSGNVSVVDNIAQDITLRKQAELVLMENEERFRLLVEAAPEAIIVADANDHRVIMVNKNAEALFATSAKDILEHGVFRFFAKKQPDGMELEQSIARNRERILDGEILTIERAIKNADGKDLLCEVRLVRFLYCGRDTIRSSWTDITGRKKIEKQLLESQAKLETALASIVDAVFISDEKGNFIHFNEAFATFHKFASKQECARHFDDYPAILDVYLENGELAPLDQWAVPRALRGETATNAIYRLKRKDTGETWIASYSFSPIRGKKGKIVGSVVVGRDITEAKQLESQLVRSERDLKAILDNLPSLVSYWDKELNCRLANSAYLVWYGLNRDTMPGMHLKDLLGEETYRKSLPYIEAVMAGQPQLFERAMPSPDGSHVRRALLNYIPDISDGAVQGFYALVTDVTFIKNAEEAMAASLKEKEVLLREIHHRVKNNLQIISSLLSLQEEGLKDQAALEALAASRSRVISMAMIHEQLYRSEDLSGIDAAEYLRQFVPKLVAAYRGAQDVTLRLDDLSPVTLALDQAVPFGLIVNELVTNAIKHAFKGRDMGAVTIRTNLAGGSVSLVVADDGVGLPEDFEQLKTKTLGLQMVAMLANQLHGALAVDSGRGTSFTLTFPHRTGH
ncbi:MAG: PAS domain S-box protein [Desulfovibrio sp.]|nr:PAS domain S-box protein [Desulfovibrio sp.]MBI4961299.1 PAS domain S-box protein [Desulfovibrio sp.]